MQSIEDIAREGLACVVHMELEVIDFWQYDGIMYIETYLQSFFQSALTKHNYFTVHVYVSVHNFVLNLGCADTLR